MLAKFVQVVRDLPAVSPIWFIKRYFVLVVTSAALPPLATALWGLICLEAVYDIVSSLYAQQHAVAALIATATHVTLRVSLAPNVQVLWLAPLDAAQMFSAAASAVGANSQSFTIQLDDSWIQIRLLPFAYEVEFVTASGKQYAARLSGHDAHRIFTACAQLLQQVAERGC